jgi:adenylate cyclase class 2
MSYEVELKFAVPDPHQLEAKLAQLQAEELPAIRQVDQYYRHPTRDFAQTDEAFRIRTVGEQSYLTYKGPKLDAATKTRREIELPFGDSPQAAAQMDDMLQLLGFRKALVVSKQRRRFHVTWQAVQVEATIDQVEGLGTYAELEIVTEEAGLDRAREAILSLAEQCQLGVPERRSYLELLLELGSP